MLYHLPSKASTPSTHTHFALAPYERIGALHLLDFGELCPLKGSNSAEGLLTLRIARAILFGILNASPHVYPLRSTRPLVRNEGVRVLVDIRYTAVASV